MSLSVRTIEQATKLGLPDQLESLYALFGLPEESLEELSNILNGVCTVDYSLPSPVELVQYKQLDMGILEAPFEQLNQQCSTLASKQTIISPQLLTETLDVMEEFHTLVSSSKLNLEYTPTVDPARIAKLQQAIRLLPEIHINYPFRFY